MSRTNETRIDRGRTTVNVGHERRRDLDAVSEWTCCWTDSLDALT